MMTDLLDHTARLLEREPTRCLNITVLHERATRDTGTHISIGPFMTLLSRHADRFVVIPGSRTIESRHGWSAEDCWDYDGALERAPGAASLVMLVPSAPDPTQPSVAIERDDVLTAVYDALVDMLHDSSADEHLRLAAAAGARELDAVRHGLAP